MNRITIVLDDELLAEVDHMVDARGYQNRSEAIRDLARGGLRQAAENHGETGECVAALAYAYDHQERDLPKRLVKLFADHHDLVLSTLQVHLNHDTGLAVSVLRDTVQDVRHLADHVIAERGVRHGRVVLFPGEEETQTHSHGGKSHKHTHLHLRRAG